MYVMECERCHAENYDEAYYCRNCGAKLDKPRNYKHTTQQTNFPYDYQQQPDNHGYQNNYQQQPDNHGYQNNYQQQPDNNYQQYNTYDNIPNSNQSHTEKTVYVFKEKMSPGFGISGIFGGSKKKAHEQKIKQILDEAMSAEQNNTTSYNSSTSTNGGIHKEHSTHTSYIGGARIHTNKTVYTAPMPPSGNEQDSEIYQMYQKAKEILDNPQQYNQQYNSSYNNSSQYPPYNSSYKKSSNTRIVSKGKLHLVTFTFIFFIILLSAFIVWCNFSDFSFRSSEVINSIVQSTHKREYLNYSIPSPGESYVTVNFSAPDDYTYSSTLKEDESRIEFEKFDLNGDSYGTATVEIYESTIEDDLDDMFYYNYHIVSEGTTQNNSGEMRMITLSNYNYQQDRYIAYMDLGNNQLLKISSYNYNKSDSFDQEIKEIITKIAESCTVVSNTEACAEKTTE